MVENDRRDENSSWDVIVVGGGAAGLSAALTLGRSLRRVAVIDAGEPRNRFAEHMHGVLGNEGAEPAELLHRGRDEAAAYGVTFLDASVVGVRATERAITVATDRPGADLSARALVVATGLSDVLPEVPGLAEHWGTGVLHCPYCHGWEVRGTRIGVLGSSPLSIHQAELVRQWSDRLTFFTAGAGDLGPDVERRLHSRGVELVESAVAEVLSEGGRLTGVRLVDDRVIALDALFAAPTLRPRDEFLAPLALERTETPMGSFLATDPTGRTSHPRVWAIGNVANPAANVPVSIGTGALTAATVNMALVGEEFDDALAAEAAAFWEERYADSERVWSGRVNATMAEVVGGLPAGDVLDLGCGEGGDAVWLAEQGWRVTAVDISPTATARGSKAAATRGVGDRITWIAHDLATWRTDERFDLVTASFLHSTVELPRTEILRNAADRVRPGGHVLLVSHVFETDEDIPPWAWRNDPEAGHTHEPVLLNPAEEIAELDLNPAAWRVEEASVRSREATGPDGVEKAMVKDGVVLLRRLPTGAAES